MPTQRPFLGPPCRSVAARIAVSGQELTEAYISKRNRITKVLDFVPLGGLGGSPREQFDRSYRALRRSHHCSCPSSLSEKHGWRVVGCMIGPVQ